MPFAVFERRGQLIGPQQQNDAELQAACAMHRQNLHRVVTQHTSRLVTGR
jgi:hypothetical protein